MSILGGFANKNPVIASAFVALTFGALSITGVRAQTAQAKGSTGDSTPATAFSIETEMLTYRALESNSEAVACDIAAYLNGVDANFANPPVGSVCDVKAGTNKVSVVLLPFDSTEFADFQVWRADIASMDRLHKKANTDCPSNSANTDQSLISPSSLPFPSQSAASNAATSTLTARSPLAIAQSVLAVMASEESTSPVGGTIRDQAFMDGVGRQLQQLGVPVLMPTAYTPHSLSMLDESSSPFLARLDSILTDRGRCLSLPIKGTEKESDKNKTIQGMIDEIDSFLGTLAPQGTKAQAPNPKSANSSAQPEVSPAPPSPSHLNAVLLADGLAAKAGMIGKEASLHILLVKALESGGSVTRFSNVFGTTIRYSGGSVGTYALFTLDGDLECSGNVYEYGGSIKAKDFQEEFGKYNPDPAKQRVFLRRGCHQQMPQ